MTAPPAHSTLLLLGDATLLTHPRAVPDDEVITLVWLPTALASSGPFNTLMPDFAYLGPLHVETRTVDGRHHFTYRVHGVDLLTGIGPGQAVATANRRIGPAINPASHTPLFAAVHHEDGRHVYSRAPARRPGLSAAHLPHAHRGRPSAGRRGVARSGDHPAHRPRLHDRRGHRAHPGVRRECAAWHPLTVAESLVGRRIARAVSAPP
jgi:hypothetical protein